MAKKQKKGELPFAVFDLVEPAQLREHILTMYLGYLDSSLKTGIDVDFFKMLNDLKKLFDYLDNPAGKGTHEILAIVKARKLIRYLIRIFFGYLRSSEKDFSKKHNELFKVMDWILYELLEECFG